MKKMFILFTITMIITSLLTANLIYACNPNGNFNGKGKLAPIVSTNWLEANGNLKDLVIVDVRSSEEYEEGHIADSVSIPFVVPFSAWITIKDDLLLELPDDNELFDTLGSFGITKKSKVVIVTSVADPYAIAAGPRVATTLKYAGVKNVSILNGGYEKWISEGKAVTTDVPEITEKVFKGKVNKNIFASIDYVENNIGKAVIIDNRDAEIYLGEVVCPFAGQTGHISTAKLLPVPDMWNDDGTYKSVNELREMVKSLAKKNDDIIVYCGVGGYGSVAWFVFTEVLGYKKVKFYDGSAEEWTRYHDMVVN
ncbi:UNVERIFIED_CONTAM: thiosulfate/3-mercaptopyruvate sulfurtransferase [Acetivibrio alkalicellulosi]